LIIFNKILIQSSHSRNISMDPLGTGHGSQTLGNQCSTATHLSDYMSLTTDHNPKFCMTFKTTIQNFVWLLKWFMTKESYITHKMSKLHSIYRYTQN